MSMLIYGYGEEGIISNSRNLFQQNVKRFNTERELADTLNNKLTDTLNNI